MSITKRIEALELKIAQTQAPERVDIVRTIIDDNRQVLYGLRWNYDSRTYAHLSLDELAAIYEGSPWDTGGTLAGRTRQ